MAYRDFDRLIVAVCGEEQQIERAMARDGMSRDEVLEPLSAANATGEKMKYADYVIDTSRTERTHTLEQTRAVYEKLRSLTH